MFTKVCVQKGRIWSHWAFPKVSSLGECRTGPVTLCPKRMFWECFPQYTWWRIYSQQFAAELEAVGKGAETHVKCSFPVNEASTEERPPELGMKAWSLHSSHISWEGTDWSLIPTPLPAVPYLPSTHTDIVWKYKVLRINYCRELNLWCVSSWIMKRVSLGQGFLDHHGS